jgi:hypothetical protein
MEKLVSDYRIQKPKEHFHKKKGGVEIGRMEKVIVFILFGALGFLWSASLTRESRVHIEGI